MGPSRYSPAPQRPSTSPLDLTDRFLYYLDASTWNRLSDHPQRTRLVDAILVGQHFAVLPSVINAIELLNTTDASRRRLLCKTLSDLLPDHNVLLGHPEDTAKLAAVELLAGNDTITIYEDSYALAFRQWIQDPDTLNEEGRELLKLWVTSLRDIVEIPWREMSHNRSWRGAKPDRQLLTGDALIPLLQDRMKTRGLQLSVDEVRRLIQGTGVWTGYAVALAGASLGLRAALRP